MTEKEQGRKKTTSPVSTWIYDINKDGLPVITTYFYKNTKQDTLIHNQ